MAKKSVIKIPSSKGIYEAEGVVVWAFIGERKHKFFVAEQGFASRPVLSDYASGLIVARLPEKGTFYCMTLKQRVESAIADLIDHKIREIEKKNRTLMSQKVYDLALARIYEIIDDVTVINGKMTKYHKAQLEANTLKAVDKSKSMRQDQRSI